MSAESIEPHINSVDMFVEIDEAVGTVRYNSEYHAERLTRKFELILQDEDLGRILGPLLRPLILLVDQDGFTEEQVERIMAVENATIHSMMSPADLEVIDKEMEHWRWKEARGKNKTSPFAYGL